AYLSGQVKGSQEHSMKRSRTKATKTRRPKPLWNIGSRKPRVRRFRWICLIPFKAIFILLGLYVLFEILTFPFLSIARLPTENPTESALMRQRIDEAHAQGTTLKIDYRWTPLSS